MFLERSASKNALAQRTKVHGVGINDSTYVTKYKDDNGLLLRCKFYQSWGALMYRVYSLTHHKRFPTYKNCTVCDEWLVFSNFKSWMEKQKHDGMVLDKDILVPGNKMYSAETCMFVPPDINLLLTDRAAKRGNYPIGVIINKESGRFISRCMVRGKKKRLGTFGTPREAFEVYCEFKAIHVREIAEECRSSEYDSRLYGALILNADRIQDMVNNYDI